jgi:nucleoside-triphosphatase THEP1
MAAKNAKTTVVLTVKEKVTFENATVAGLVADLVKVGGSDTFLSDGFSFFDFEPVTEVVSVEVTD